MSEVEKAEFEVKKAALTFGVVAVLIGIVGGIFSYLAIEERNAFKTLGVSVNADVIGKNKEYDEGWSYWLEFLYTDGEGRTHEAWDFVNEKVYNAATPHTSTFPIAYLPQDPTRHMSRADIESRFYELLMIGGAVFVFLGIGLIVVRTYL